MTIIEFMEARLAEDEAEARETADADAEFWAETRGDGTYFARHDPERILREVASGRALLESLRQAQKRFEDTPPGDYHRHDAVRMAWMEAARQRAMSWADHPDYEPRWMPS
jgi:Family of unknown function (DUF6221)